ncbi:MAG: sugar transferase [Acidimicrobiia bacterium]|nr:sugar transferase [Acidimicrobiia bacterium]
MSAAAGRGSLIAPSRPWGTPLAVIDVRDLGILTDDGSLHRRVRRAPQVRLSKVLVATGDLLAVWLAMVAALMLDRRGTTTDPTPAGSYLLVSMLSLPGWVLALRGRRLYESRFIGRRSDELRRIVDACFLTLLGIIVADFAVRLSLARTWVATVFVLAVMAVSVYREAVRQVFHARRRHGVGLRRVVIVGDNEEALAIEDMLRRDRTVGYEVVARVGERSGDQHADVGRLLVDDTMRAVHDTDAHGVVIAATSLTPSTSNRLVRAIAYSGLHLELSSTLSNISASRLTMRPMGRFPVVYVEPVKRFGWRQVAKRVFDLTAAIGLLILCLPIMTAAALAVKFTSKGPVFFSQERLGRNGAVFRIYKIRSMVDDAEERRDALRAQNAADGPLFKVPDDPRITPIGRVLRATSLDELPQLWNVVKGEMSLVGPRPALPEETDGWSHDLFDRLRVRPGMTGMWQVSGRSEASFGEYMRLDLYYVDNWSLIIDLTILLKTIPAVIARRGAS